MSKKLKMNQVIAITNGEKSRKQKELSKMYQILSKDVLFDGYKKDYTPFEEDDAGANKLPSEEKLVQVTTKQAINSAKEVIEDMFNMVATQDIGNTVAKANVSVNGDVIINDVPVPYLIFLEKQLQDIETFIRALPELDPAEKWEIFDNVNGVYKSSEKETIRSKKVRKNHVLAKATEKHPAQVETYQEDVPVGKWKAVKFSGNIEKSEKETMLLRVRELSTAVKIAREDANNTEVEKSDMGSKVLDYIFG